MTTNIIHQIIKFRKDNPLKRVIPNIEIKLFQEGEEFDSFVINDETLEDLVFALGYAGYEEMFEMITGSVKDSINNKIRENIDKKT